MNYAHTCSCGAKYSHKEWSTLPYVGIQRGEPGLELRNCACGSTRAVEIPRVEAHRITDTHYTVVATDGPKQYKADAYVYWYERGPVDYAVELHGIDVMHCDGDERIEPLRYRDVPQWVVDAIEAEVTK